MASRAFLLAMASVALALDNLDPEPIEAFGIGFLALAAVWLLIALVEWRDARR